MVVEKGHQLISRRRIIARRDCVVMLRDLFRAAGCFGKNGLDLEIERVIQNRIQFFDILGPEFMNLCANFHQLIIPGIEQLRHALKRRRVFGSVP